MRTFVALLSAGVLAVARPAFADDAPVTKSAAADCAALGALRLPDVAIVSGRSEGAGGRQGPRARSRTARSPASSARRFASRCCCPTRGTGASRWAAAAASSAASRTRSWRSSIAATPPQGPTPGIRPTACRPAGRSTTRATGQLRVSRRASHRGSRQGDRPGVLRRRQRLRLLPGVFQRRAPGVDGGAAIPGRLRRHRLRRAGLRLHATSRRRSSHTRRRRFREPANLKTSTVSPADLALVAAAALEAATPPTA